MVGKMVSTCLVQGGQPPVCFADGIADYLIYDEVKSEPCIADITDCIVRRKLNQVCGESTIVHIYSAFMHVLSQLLSTYLTPDVRQTIGFSNTEYVFLWTHSSLCRG